MLTREQILSANELPTESVDVPEWGGAVRVAVMSGILRDRFEYRVSSMYRSLTGEIVNGRAMLAAYCIVDDAGKRMFEESDIEALGAKSWIALERVVSAAQKLNKMTDADIEAAKGN